MHCRLGFADSPSAGQVVIFRGWKALNRTKLDEILSERGVSDATAYDSSGDDDCALRRCPADQPMVKPSADGEAGMAYRYMDLVCNIAAALEVQPTAMWSSLPSTT